MVATLDTEGWTGSVIAAAFVVFAYLVGFCAGETMAVDAHYNEACASHCATTVDMGGHYDELRGECACAGEVE